MKKVLIVAGLLISSLGCVSAASLGYKSGKSTIGLDQAVVVNNYDKLRSIIVEEATNNGFSNLTEVKPSQYNNWEGKLSFVTHSDKFMAEIIRDGNKYSLYMHGGTTTANVDGAIRAITQRVAELNNFVPAAK